MALSLMTIAFAFGSLDGNTSQGTPTTLGVLTLVCLVVFIASFAVSLGPITWTMIAEICPNRIGGRAVAVAANWGAAFVVSMTLLTLLDSIGESATFWLFGVLSALAFVWIAAKVPETKGRSLEQIGAAFDNEAPEPVS